MSPGRSLERAGLSWHRGARSRSRDSRRARRAQHLAYRSVSQGSVVPESDYRGGVESPSTVRPDSRMQRVVPAHFPETECSLRAPAGNNARHLRDLAASRPSMTRFGSSGLTVEPSTGGSGCYSLDDVKDRIRLAGRARSGLRVRRIFSPLAVDDIAILIGPGLKGENFGPNAFLTL